MLPKRTRILLFAGGALALLLLIPCVTAAVRDVRAFDEAVLLTMRVPGDPRDPIGHPFFEEFVRDITALGSQYILALGVLAACGFLALHHQYHAVILLLAATAGAFFVSILLKGMFDRPRPELVSNISYTTGFGSFPSGHSTMSAAVYLTLGALLTRLVKPMGHKVYFLALSLLLTLLIGLSRIYLGMHYPTDVMAGWIIGAIWAGLCWEVAAWLQKRGVVEPPG
ncbi:MAG TPA: phosphatase PAP2 family protein [Fibrobacteria bacterium]|nr:phosphatase PAP2 family protein [Fibrobacteria bacterium]